MITERKIRDISFVLFTMKTNPTDRETKTIPCFVSLILVEESRVQVFKGLEKTLQKWSPREAAKKIYFLMAVHAITALIPPLLSLKKRFKKFFFPPDGTAFTPLSILP